MYKGASQKARNCLILHFLHNWFWTGNNKKMLVPNLEFWQCKIYSVWKLYILWNPFIIVYSSINEAECLRLGMILGCGYNQSLLTVHLLGPGWGGGGQSWARWSKLATAIKRERQRWALKKRKMLHPLCQNCVATK